jgi:hypothetical protein
MGIKCVATGRAGARGIDYEKNLCAANQPGSVPGADSFVGCKKCHQITCRACLEKLQQECLKQSAVQAKLTVIELEPLSTFLNNTRLDADERVLFKTGNPGAAVAVQFGKQCGCIWCFKHTVAVPSTG